MDSRTAPGDAWSKDPRLQTLLAVGVRPDQAVRQAEAWGLPPQALTPYAGHLLAPLIDGDPTFAATCLVLGIATSWQPLVVPAKPFGERLVRALRGDWSDEDLSVLEPWFGGDAWEAFKVRVLKRLGYPACLLEGKRESLAGGVEIQDWLDGGQLVIEDALELRSFHARARRKWEIETRSLVLVDGRGPETLSIDPKSDCAAQWQSISVRLRRVSGTRAVWGQWGDSRVTVMDCVDLSEIQDDAKVVIAKNCPALRRISLSSNAHLLHVQNCSALRAVEVWDDGAHQPPMFQVGSFVLDACPVLVLPPQMRVSRNMVVRRQGSTFRWPRDLHVGGDLYIKDCADLWEIPSIEVGGTLRVKGLSGVRKLGAGLRVEGDLDVRGCHQLEGIPAGLRVGGRIQLPPHLERVAPRLTWFIEPFLEEEVETIEPHDLQTDLCTVLRVKAFPEFSTASDRSQEQAEADHILDRLKCWVVRDPSAESMILYEASNVWDDLARSRWETDKPYDHCQYSQALDEIPITWFREILFEA